MPTCQDIVLFAAYNAQLKRQVYDAAAQLPPGEAAADRGAFFGSVTGTLNHLLTADTIWLMRFATHPARFRAVSPLRDQPAPTSLAHSFGAELPVLREYRERLDGIIAAFAAELKPEDLDVVFEYRSMKGAAFRKHFGSVLLHVFNHQTHHRGQTTTLLSHAGIDVESVLGSILHGALLARGTGRHRCFALPSSCTESPPRAAHPGLSVARLKNHHPPGGGAATAPPQPATPLKSVRTRRFTSFSMRGFPSHAWPYGHQLTIRLHHSTA